MGVSMIFLATDSRAIVEEAERLKGELLASGWSSLIWNTEAQRADKEQEMKMKWYTRSRSSMGFDVLLDLEMFQGASYLIGSMISNVFRLGVELNHARRI